LFGGAEFTTSQQLSPDKKFLPVPFIILVITGEYFIGTLAI
jgi:hypothetical protein